MWRSRITHKIGAIYGIGILGLLIVAGIYSVGLSTQGQYKRVANDATAIVELANKLRVELLESRMTEKEFLLRKDMKYASHHAELARTIDANFDTIGDRIANARQNDLIPQINAIHDGFEKYVTDFATLAEAKRRLGLDENSGIEGQLRNSVHEIESTLNEFNEQSLLVTMLMMRRHEKDFMLRRDLRYGDDMKKRAVEFTAGLAAASIPDAIKATMAEKLAAYQSDFFAWMDGAVTVANTQEATSDVYSAIEPRIDAFLKSVEQVSAAATASNDAARAATNMQMEIAILLMIVAVSAFGFLIGRSVSGPLTTITTALAELANGNKSVEILFTDRSDEIGDNARAAKNFRDNLVRMEKLEAQQKEGEVRAATERKTAEEREAAERRAAAEQEEAAQKAAMHKLANEFEAAVGSIIETVSSASIELEAAADTLTKIADTTQRLSTVVASASDEASTNVQSVASATEEGASSLQEISRQLQESSKVANNAAKQAARTDADVSKLSNAAQRIGDVVKLIATVAEQTNLLALNATIEAARAGEAGKGFAVVAQEVKALAAMTAKAAEEIRAQITGIQVATQESVTAITEIGGTIGWISEIATATVARMEKQGTATREIVRNVREAAKCTAQVAVNITDVNRGAIETGSASARLLSSAQVLANESNRLKAEVGKFLNTVRAA